MLFWILVAVLTAVVGAVLLYPLLRGAKEAEDCRSGEAEVYRDQLRELDRDLAGGLISVQEAGYARAEIGRRLIAAAKDEKTEAKSPVHGGYRLAQAFIIVILPAVGLCLYLANGDPGLPAQPLEARLEKPGNDLAISIVKIEQHLARNPDDAKGWEVLAPIYFKTNRIGDAELAYRNVIRLLGPNAARLGDLGEVLVVKANGVVTAEARGVLQQSLALDAANPRTLFYLHWRWNRRVGQRTRRRPSRLWRNSRRRVRPGSPPLTSISSRMGARPWHPRMPTLPAIQPRRMSPRRMR